MPRPCCCKKTEGCDICSDNFNRADGDDVDVGSSCGWTEVSGAWSIASFALTTSDTNAVVRCDATHPDETGAAHLIAFVTAPNGALVRLIFNYVDSGNYHFAEAKVGFGATIAIYQRSGGTETQLVTRTATIAAGSPFSLMVCFTEGIAVASVGTSAITAEISTASALRYVGLGTGGTVPSVVTFDDFSFSKPYDANNPDCDECVRPDCNLCEDSEGNKTSPRVMKLTLTDVPNNAAPDGCLDCSQFEGVILCEYIGKVDCGFGQIRDIWKSASFDIDCGTCGGSRDCTGLRWTVQLSRVDAVTCDLWITLAHDENGDCAQNVQNPEPSAGWFKRLPRDGTWTCWSTYDLGPATSTWFSPAPPCLFRDAGANLRIEPA